MQNFRTSLVDPDTPEQKQTMTSIDGRTLDLAFSDEFEKAGRTFYEGDDPYWSAIDLWYSGTQDLQWYDPDAITTKDGSLEIRFDAFQNHLLNYRSGMLQSWNKLCMRGGRIEARVSLPASSKTQGLWPAVWMMGNLGRAGYPASNHGTWPYSYDDVCDAGITKNQSSTDPGFSYQSGMKLPACTCKGEDHPSPGRSRSAPELDLIEATVELDKRGELGGKTSQTFQVAPFDPGYQINKDFSNILDADSTKYNPFMGTPYQQMVSGLTDLNPAGYEGKGGFQEFALEYIPGPKGKIVWFLNGVATWSLDGRAIGPNGNIGQRIIPLEPMSININLALSEGFGDIDFRAVGKMLPATMRVDYIRVYQDSDDHMGCDPEGFETTGYISNHDKAYTNPNLTTWDQTGYPWPKNELVDGC